jgi:molybdopterin-guanine dinucleotide biosynthesis protein A
MTDAPPTLGVILAGGLARRMGGGDKPMRTVGGRTILDRVIARFAPQVTRLVLNANGDPARFAFTGLPVVADGVPDHPGPLAGVLAGLYVAAAEGIDWVATVAADGPFLPADLVARLHLERAAAGLPMVCAASGGFTHPPIGLWPVALRHDLRTALTVENERKIDRWTARFGCAAVVCPADAVDPFLHAVPPEDLAEAAAILARWPDA